MRDVSRVFRDGWRREVTAVAGLTLRLRRGEIYGLLGPNGAGKSTALHCLLGLLKPTRGSIAMFGRAVESGSPGFRYVGYMPEDWTAYDFLTVSEMLSYFAELYGLATDGRAEIISRALERTGLSAQADRRLARLSKGMRQRAALAQAILTEPALLVLDEPTKELDPLGRRDVRVLLEDFAQRGAAILMSSHLLSEIESICDRVGVMHHGALVAEGELATILASHDCRIIRFAVPPGAALPTGAVKESDTVAQWRAASSSETHARLAYLRTIGADIISVASENIRLEDYFIEVLSKP
ncbi:MAG TPA: ABC transporter ATP-binding protein [Candidatus Polarisedimenticolaceae bacterium]|nr:ABC transporter ATP-binding protein [Candidatus Polarisedimenticolaceae bacterium]